MPRALLPPLFKSSLKNVGLLNQQLMFPLRKGEGLVFRLLPGVFLGEEMGRRGRE